MITERDEIKCRASIDMVEASSLDPHAKLDLRESIEEAKANLNGRSLEERVLSIAQNQFDTTRFLAEIIIQFKNVADEVKNTQPKRTWKDVVAECKWPLVVLGSIVSVCAIFQPQIISLLTSITGLIH